MSGLERHLAALRLINPYVRAEVGGYGLTLEAIMPGEGMARSAAAMYQTTSRNLIAGAMLLACEGMVIDVAVASHLASRLTPDLAAARVRLVDQYAAAVVLPPETALQRDGLHDKLVARLTASIETVAAARRVPEKSLWPVAVDRVLGAMVSTGQRIGWPADDLMAEIEALRRGDGSPFNTRFSRVVGIEGRLFVWRAACCHLDRAGGPLCANCPKQPDRYAAMRAEVLSS